MTRITLVVAALLLTNLGGIAAAADSSEHSSKHAQKLVILLDSMGANSKQIKNFISTVDASVEDGYLNLASHQAPGGGRISLRYRLDAKPYTGTSTAKRLEIIYQPKFNSHFDIIARTDSITVNYHLKF